MNQEIWRIFKFPENGHPLELGSITEDIPEPFCSIQSELSPEILDQMERARLCRMT